jgi:hypothetical protein
MSLTESHETQFRSPKCNSVLKRGFVLYSSPLQLHEAGGSCAQCYLASDERGSGIVAAGGIGKGFGDPEQRHVGLFGAAPPPIGYRYGYLALIDKWAGMNSFVSTPL